MTEHINNILRLEIDASDATNRIANHSAQANTAGFTTSPGFVSRVEGSYGLTGTAYRLTASVSGGARQAAMLGPTLSMAEGEYANVGASFRSTSSLSPSIGVQYLDSAGTVLLQRSVTYTIPASTTTRMQMGSGGVAPANTAGVRFLIGEGQNNSFSFDLWELVLVTSPTESLVQDTSFYDGPRWQNILGSAYTLNTFRGNELDGVVDTPEVGTLTAVLGDPLIDPTKNPRVRVGRRVRMTAYTDGQGWIPLWAGKLTDISVNYADKKPRVTLQAVDVIHELKNTPQPQAWNGSLAQRAGRAMDPTGQIVGVDYFVGSNTGEFVTTPKIIDVQENASVLDHLTWIGVALDSQTYVNQDGALDIGFGRINNTPILFSDVPEAASAGAVPYTDIDTSFGSQALFNEFMINRHNLDEEDGEKVYGAFTNTASKSQWGTKSVTVDTNDGVPREIAERYGRIYANPEIFASSVKFNSGPMTSRALNLTLDAK